MSKYRQHFYEVANPDKYRGKKKPFMRSSWETIFARMCDNNPAIISWASEPFMIPYRNPFTGKKTIYVPDFMIVYVDSKNQTHGEVIEIKPKKQASLAAARSQRDKAAAILNKAKWEVAEAWCKAQGLRFRVITEDMIFEMGPPKTPRKKAVRKAKKR